MNPVKQIILFLCLIINPFLLLAQGFIIDWGETYPHKKPSITISFSDDYYYVLNKQKKLNGIMQFDYNHKLISIKQLDIEYNPQYQHYWQIVNLKSGRYHLMAEEDKKNNTIQLLCAHIKTDGQFGNQMKSLIVFFYEKRTMVAGEDGPNKDKIGVSTSNDSTKVLITSVKLARDYGSGKGNEIYSVAVFDENMDLLWKKDVEIPFADKKIEIKQFKVNNDGEVFLLTKIDQKQPNPEKKIDYKISIFKITPDRDLLEIVVDPKNVNPLETAFQILDNQDIIVLGFYKRKGKKYLIREDGLFAFRFNSSGKQLFHNTQDFDDDFSSKLKAKREPGEKNKLNHFELQIDKIRCDAKNENYLLITENRYKTIVTDANSVGMNSKRTYLYSNQILVFSVSNEGKINWATPIIKDFGRKESLKNSISYVMTSKKGNLYFVFNDEKTSKEKSSYNKKGKLTATFTELVKIDTEGEIKSRDLLFLSNEHLGPFDSQYSKNIEEGKILIYNAKYNKHKYGVLTVE